MTPPKNKDKTPVTQILDDGILGFGKDKDTTKETALAVPAESLKRKNPPKKDAEEEHKPLPVSAGPLEKAGDYAFNPSRDKIREVTIVDRMQGKLFPQLDMVNLLRHFCLEVAEYRQNPENYSATYGKEFPVQPDALDEFIFRTAQWQKSVGGKNLESIVSIALAEKENQGDDEGISAGSRDPFEK